MSIILDEAKKIVYEKNAIYGQSEDNFAVTASLWSAYLGKPIQPEDVGMMLILMKVASERYMHKKDNLVDIAGYAECVAKLHEHRNAGKCDSCGRLAKVWIETKEGKKFCPRCMYEE